MKVQQHRKNNVEFPGVFVLALGFPRRDLMSNTIWWNIQGFGFFLEQPICVVFFLFFVLKKHKISIKCINLSSFCSLLGLAQLYNSIVPIELARYSRNIQTGLGRGGRGSINVKVVSHALVLVPPVNQQLPFTVMVCVLFMNWI